MHTCRQGTVSTKHLRVLSLGPSRHTLVVNGVSPLAAADADEPAHLGPETGGVVGELGLVAIDGRGLPDEVSLVGLDEAGALDELPAEEENGGEDLHGVAGEEGLGVGGVKGVVVVGEDEDELDGEGKVGAVGLEPAVVGHLGAVDALGLAGAVVEDEGDVHDDEINHAAGGDDVDEPGDDLGGAAAALKEGQHGEDHDDEEAVEGHAVAPGLAQEAGGAALEGEAVEGAGGAVGVGVSGGEDGGEHEGVDKVREDVDAHVVHGNDIGGRGGAAVGVALAVGHLLQVRVVVAEHDADAQGAAEEEDGEAGVDGLEGRLDVDTRPLGLGGHHGDVLGTDDGEAGVVQRRQEALEAAQVTRAEVLGKGARVLPVAEAVGVPFRVAANHGDKGEEEEHEDEDDLASGEPELGLTVSSHSKQVDSTTFHATQFSTHSSK